MSARDRSSVTWTARLPRLGARSAAVVLLAASAFADGGGASPVSLQVGSSSAGGASGQVPGGRLRPPAEDGAPAPPPSRPGPAAEERLPKLDTAEAELARAGAWKRRARTLRGGERLRALASAVEAYRAASRHWNDRPLVAAESAFRAGEVLRALERDAEARAEFETSRTVGRDTSFAARAGLELGHLARRAGDVEGARDAYLRVARDERCERRYRDDAALWASRMEHELGRSDVARLGFESLARTAESVLDRIEAYDEWCASFVDVGDLEAAAGVLALCREASNDLALEETPLGERVRNALTRMHSIRRLEQAVRARQKGVTVTKK